MKIRKLKLNKKKIVERMKNKKKLKREQKNSKKITSKMKQTSISDKSKSFKNQKTIVKKKINNEENICNILENAI